MLKQFLIIGFIIVFSSCGRNEKDEEMMAKMLNETLVNSAKNISISNEYVYHDFNYKLENPASSEKASYLKNKIDSIKFQANGICNYIDSIKILKGIDWGSLNKYITESKKIFLSIDEDLSKEFSDNINKLSSGLDSLSNAKSDSFLKNISRNNQMIILSKLFCDVKIFENELIKFLNFRISNSAMVIDLYSTLVGQNVNHLKCGEELIISAGVGGFSSKAKAQITIAQKLIPVIDGQATYKLKAIGKPGKHTIPIRIVFKDEYDNMKTEIQTVEYTIDP